MKLNYEQLFDQTFVFLVSLKFKGTNQNFFSLFVCLCSIDRGIELCQSNFDTYLVSNQNKYHKAILCLTIVISVLCWLPLPQKRTRSFMLLEKQQCAVSQLSFYLYFYLIFAILHFGRRKFEHDPLVIS